MLRIRRRRKMRHLSLRVRPAIFCLIRSSSKSVWAQTNMFYNEARTYSVGEDLSMHNRPWVHRADCSSSALQHFHLWCRSPSRQKSCCKNSGSGPHPGSGCVWSQWQTCKTVTYNKHHFRETILCIPFCLFTTFLQSRWDWVAGMLWWPAGRPVPDYMWFLETGFCLLCSSHKKGRSAPESPDEP